MSGPIRVVKGAVFHDGERVDLGCLLGYYAMLVMLCCLGKPWWAAGVFIGGYLTNAILIIVIWAVRQLEKRRAYGDG